VKDDTLCLWTHGVAPSDRAFRAVEVDSDSNGWMRFQEGEEGKIQWSSGSVSDRTLSVSADVWARAARARVTEVADADSFVAALTPLLASSTIAITDTRPHVVAACVDGDSRFALFADGSLTRATRTDPVDPLHLDSGAGASGRLTNNADDPAPLSAPSIVATPPRRSPAAVGGGGGRRLAWGGSMVVVRWRSWSFAVLEDDLCAWTHSVAAGAPAWRGVSLWRNNNGWLRVETGSRKVTMYTSGSEGTGGAFPDAALAAADAPVVVVTTAADVRSALEPVLSDAIQVLRADDTSLVLCAAGECCAALFADGGMRACTAADGIPTTPTLPTSGGGGGGSGGRAPAVAPPVVPPVARAVSNNNNPAEDGEDPVAVVSRGPSIEVVRGPAMPADEAAGVDYVAATGAMLAAPPYTVSEGAVLGLLPALGTLRENPTALVPILRALSHAAGHPPHRAALRAAGTSALVSDLVRRHAAAPAFLVAAVAVLQLLDG